MYTHTPALDNLGNVYYWSQMNGITSRVLASGAVRWRGPAMAAALRCSSITIDTAAVPVTVYASAVATVYAVDAGTGAQLWSMDTSAYGAAMPPVPLLSRRASPWHR